MFSAPKFFWRRAPEFWKLDYKTRAVSDHVAKFHGDRPRDLGDYALEKKKKHHEHFISPPVTTYGRPKNTRKKLKKWRDKLLLFHLVLLVRSELWHSVSFSRGRQRPGERLAWNVRQRDNLLSVSGDQFFLVLRNGRQTRGRRREHQAVKEAATDWQ